ncbi:Actin-related protein [Carpediemonas membranifera]|uniref:Actin-related protein 2 n=1 Tax=Carpediemonas membranifera TaxID=201153 RepID=A0A8J6AYM5_9EUKA|nr:Actin-related protein [Carpediemonas membranifera]|eukprot:KAG9391638.1 Actin-related protein [Carpediemonas membranifera]
MDLPAVICDNGTGFVKCGFAGDDFPTSTFPALLGRPTLRFKEELLDVELKDVMIGDECTPVRSMLELRHPLEHGVIKDWDDMKLLWDYTFNEKLKVDPTERRIVLTEAPMNPKKNRERMVETMLEDYQFQGCFVEYQAKLCLYAQGLTSGVVIDSGDGVTHIVPVSEGYVLHHLIKRIDVAGRDITRYLIKLLLARGYAFNSTADFEVIRELKEKLCYTASDWEMEKRLALETTSLVETYNLPDGRTIKCAQERFQAPEVLFQPDLIDVESVGMAEALFNVIQNSDIDVRSSFYEHIVLSGGSSMFPGLPYRLGVDLKELYIRKVLKGRDDLFSQVPFKINIEDPPRRKHFVFIGAAVLGQVMASNNDAWITKQEWEEVGPNIVWQK